MSPAGPLLVPEPIRLAILAHADNCLPDECCGLIATEGGGIRFVYPLTNANPSPVSFTVDPNEHFGAMRHAESQGWEITGVFHSHPQGEPTPSPTDVAMAWDPDWIHLIVGGGELGGFRIMRGDVEAVGLLVSTDPGWRGDRSY
ncbi:MAG: M67 family metallopeptidase [Actinomycetota bacterium]|nr:M67 family metallopeptidase [Actinomycetota bacterium]